MSEFGIPMSLGLFYAGVFGTLIGSYLNVVVYRVPRGLSTFRPRSRCPGCNRNIAWYDNLPVISYLVLKARCRHCQSPISLRYPAVELSTGLLFATAFACFGWTASTLIAFVLVSLLLSLALIDQEHLLLPDAVTLPGLIVGLAVSPFSGITTPASAGLGALLGALLLLFMIALYYMLRGELGMGLGDPKMLGMIGAFLGAPKIIVTILIASLTGTLVSLTLILLKRANRSTRMPFGVYLACGAMIAMFAGDFLIEAYLTP